MTRRFGSNPPSCDGHAARDVSAVAAASRDGWVALTLARLEMGHLLEFGRVVGPNLMLYGQRVSRDKVIDGFRAIAVSGVVVGHAMAYRFAAEFGAQPWSNHLIRLAQPLSDLGVKLFFVISGYIITTLLLKEEQETGRVNIGAFYTRRVFRIVPPFMAFLLVVLALRSTGFLELPGSHFAASASFTCNTGFVDCGWWVAHTWTLAVEEQYYLAWPLVLTLLPPGLRSGFLAATTVVLLGWFAVLPYQYHSNLSSFPCIAIGAYCASSPRSREWVAKHSGGAIWLVIAASLTVGYLTPAVQIAEAITPFALVYLLFSSYQIRWLVRVLEVRVVQWIGLGSYSLYLWQQLFLARPDQYLQGAPSLWLLPATVLGSVFLVERPFMRLGRRASQLLSRPKSPDSAMLQGAN